MPKKTPLQVARSRTQKRYARVVHAIADTLGASYTVARSFYPPVKQFLLEAGESISRAAVERHPKKVKEVSLAGEVGGVVEPPAVEEWEVTVKYTVGRGKHHGEVVDVTLRMIGKAGLRFTNAQVRAAAWYAMQHGATSLSEFSLEAVDWYNTRRGGATQEYHYEHGGRDTALENARGIFKTVGIGGLRVALVE